MDNVTLTVTVDEANVILASLAAQPYQSVASLITKLQEQGQSQITSQPAAAEESASDTEN